MKKLFAMLLAVVMMMSLATVAFAEEQDLSGVLDKKGVITKTYDIKNGTAPAETFTFKFEGLSYENNEGDEVPGATIPAIANQTIAFDAISADATKTAEFEIDPDDYNLGVYTYRVTEVVPTTTTTGVDYSEEELYLVLTILRDEESRKHYVAAMHYEDADEGVKNQGFTNSYDAGSLSVKKTISGNMADMSKKFAFTIKFTIPQGTQVNSAVTLSVAGAEAVACDITQDVTFNLGHNETAIINNLPAGVSYVISEEADGYTQTVPTEADGSIEGGDQDAAVYNNELKSEIDTGILMDSAPYVVMLLVAAAGLVLFTNKRRVQD